MEAAFFDDPGGAGISLEIACGDKIVAKGFEAELCDGFHRLRHQSPAPIVRVQVEAKFPATETPVHGIIRPVSCLERKGTDKIAGFLEHQGKGFFPGKMAVKIHLGFFQTGGNLPARYVRDLRQDGHAVKTGQIPFLQRTKDQTRGFQRMLCYIEGGIHLKKNVIFPVQDVQLGGFFRAETGTVNHILHITEAAFFHDTAGLIVPDKVAAGEPVEIKLPEAIVDDRFHRFGHQSLAPVVLIQNIADFPAHGGF